MYPVRSSLATRDLLQNSLYGAAAGFIAAGPMIIAMHLLKRPGTRVPPREVTMGILHKVDADRHLDKEERLAATGLSHFAYGASAGAPYGLIAKEDFRSAVVTGPVWGLAVWAASYAGWLPAAGILPPPWHRSTRRNGLIIGAHLLWGTLLGVSFAALRQKDRT